MTPNAYLILNVDYMLYTMLRNKVHPWVYGDKDNKNN